MMVYIYTFPNGKKYVGQTSRSLEERASRGDGYINSPAVYNAIRKYGWNNIHVETIPCNSKEEMNELEKKYIHLYKTNNNKYGYNLTIGGEGIVTINRKEVCKLWNQGLGISEIAKKIGCAGTSITQILKSEKIYDKKEVDKRKIKRIALTSGKKLKEYYNTEEHKKERRENGLKGAKSRSKPVIVFKDKECTQMVGIYPSGRQCAKELNIDHSSPSYALNHNHYSNGYYFYFLSDKDKDKTECLWEDIFK